MKQSRVLLSLTLVVSALYVIAAYNLYFSWLKTIAKTEAFATSPIVAESQRELSRAWVSSTFIDLPVLGIKIHTTDTSFVGSVVIVVLFLMTFFSVRKQNHTIGQTLRRALESDDDEHLRYIYAGINMASTFNPISGNDDPIRSLEYSGEPVSQSKIFGIRELLWGALLFPGIAIAVGLVVDVVSLFMVSPFRDGYKTVWETALSNPLYFVQIGLMISVAMFMAWATLSLGWRCVCFQKATFDLMQEFSQRIRERRVGSPASFEDDHGL